MNTDLDSGSLGEASLVLRGFCCVSINFSRKFEAKLLHCLKKQKQHQATQSVYVGVGSYSYSYSI